MSSLPPVKPFPLILGGETIDVPPIMHFDALERAWPAVKAMAEARDTVAQTAAALAMVSAVLITTRPELSIAELKKRLRVNDAAGGDERPGLMDVAQKLMDSSGLVKKGEATPPAGEAAPAASESPTSNIS